MNLLDQKIKEKLMLFNNIDKETLSDTHSTYTTTSRPKQKQINKAIAKEEQFNNLSSKQYDLIYANFTGNAAKPMQIATAILPNDSDAKAMIGLRRKTPSESFINKTNRLSRSKSKEKTPPNESGDRLYNYGFYIKNKIKEKRKHEEEEIHRQMTPKILARSKKLIKDCNTPVEERLYKLNKTTHSDISTDEKEKGCHTPQLNKNSLLMAEKLEPSSVRLLKKKKRPQLSNKGNYLHSNTQEDKMNNSSSSSKNSNRFNELYAKGIETMHKRDQKCKEQQTKSEEEYKKFAYKPNITKNSPLIENNIIRKEHMTLSPLGNKGDDIYKKHCEWKKKLDKQNEKKKRIKEEEISKDCTFKPEIMRKNLPNDEKFILKNVPQMNQYVTKRRGCIQMKKEYEDYKSKRLGSVVNNTLLQPTIPRGFKFQTENRSHSRDKKERKSNCQAIQMIKQQIEKNSKGTALQLSNKRHFGDPEEEQRELFTKAVNALHSQIDQLNI